MALLLPATTAAGRGLGGSAYPELVRGLVAAWSATINEAALDLVGWNHGTKGALVSTVASHGWAWDFDFQSPWTGFIDTSRNAYSYGIRRHATFSAWYRSSATDFQQGIISDWKSNKGFNVRFDGTSNDTYTFYVYPNDHRIVASTGGRSGVWTHLCGVMDGANMYLYADGIRIGSQTLGEDIGDSLETIHIGSRGDESNINLMNGEIDDALIWDRALDPSEIRKLALLPRGEWNRRSIQVEFNEAAAPAAGPPTRTLLGVGT